MKRPHADLAIKYFTDDTVKIQFKPRAGDSWEDCETIPAFYSEFFYREKKPKRPPVTYYYRSYLAISVLGGRPYVARPGCAFKITDEGFQHWVGDWQETTFEMRDQK